MQISTNNMAMGNSSDIQSITKAKRNNVECRVKKRHINKFMKFVIVPGWLFQIYTRLTRDLVAVVAAVQHSNE